MIPVALSLILRSESMLFSSTVFLYFFLPTVLFTYYIICKKSRALQNTFLLLASLFFYAWGEPRFVSVMVASIIVNWCCGLAINSMRPNKNACRWIVGIDAVVNLGLLFVFKYLNFTNDIIHSMFGLRLPMPDIVLPIGISFLLFRQCHMLLMCIVEKGRCRPIFSILACT